MSFSVEVKNELARVTGDRECCHVAELASLMRMGGTMLIGGNKSIGVNFTTENPAVARKVLTLIKKGFHLRTEVVVSRGRRLKKTNSYAVRVAPSQAVAQLLVRLGIMQGDSLNISQDTGVLKKSCCRRSYLRGAFLGGGSVNKPAGDYHLELVTGNQDFAKTLVRIMRAFRLSARMTDRKNDYIVYLKDGDTIISFLNIIGAHQALMDFESVRVIKDMRNQVNRLVNCETANLQKTVNAALRQVESIQHIARTTGLHNLPASLREAAEVRLSHPEATLSELVEALDGRISKSGMNHRLRKLEQLAADMTQEGQL